MVHNPDHREQLEKAIPDLAEPDELAMAHCDLGKVRLHMGQFAVAHRHFDLAQKEDPKSFQTMIEKGELYLGEGLYEDAITMANKAASKSINDPGRARSLFLKAEASMGNFDANTAEDSYGQAAKLNPSDIKVNTRLEDLNELRQIHDNRYF